MRGIQSEDTEYAVIDGQLMPARDGAISVQDEGFLRGDGAFEVLMVYRCRPFAAGEHLDRLERSCAALRLDCQRPLVEHDLETLVRVSPRQAYAVRIVLTRAGRRVILAEQWGHPTGPSRLWTVANHSQPLLAGIKSLSYAGNMLSQRLATEEGCDDALWLSDEGYVLEAQTAAFFWVSPAGELSTPPLSEGILDSITRRLIIDHMEVRERRCPYREALTPREAFLASTLKEIQPVAEIDRRPLPRVPGVATSRVKSVFRGLVMAASQS